MTQQAVALKRGIERPIETALMPGRFISYNAGFSSSALSRASTSDSRHRWPGIRPRHVSQFYHDLSNGRPQVYDSKDGEMLERSIRHAWKSVPTARSNAHRHASRQLPSTTSGNNDVPRSIPVNLAV
jgi:hypothetical protein